MTTAPKSFEEIYHVPTSYTAQSNDPSENNKPNWAHRVDRWFQLNEDGFAVASALELWLQKPEVLVEPKLIIQSSLYGSHGSDYDFVHSGADSPAKFVYTLPNINVGVIAQFLNWHGISYNFTGSNSWEQAEQLAQSYRESYFSESSQQNTDFASFSIWIFSIDNHPVDSQKRSVRWKQLF